MRYRLKDISDVSKLNLNKTIMEKQILETAVEFYAEQEVKLTLDFISNKLNELEYGIKRIELLKQAKEMEKEQIGKAFLNGRIKEIGQGVLFDLQPLTETFNYYYNETFKSE